ncbi:putative nucleotidyltransferase substrate binding domain-containing protein [Aestuariirhabdus sp. LZHN29]|uniref:putative nucleotidyltransferase substrate binding domain-containing protein n=1 Tax=Aestuariirhabdus sp. LZHN29 TaxID=3417462 RepID=UPI003CEC44C6
MSETLSSGHTLDIQHPPFKYLSREELDFLMTHLKVREYEPDSVIFDADQIVDDFFVVQQGVVGETDPNAEDGEGMITHYIADDCFGALAIMNGISQHRFTALEKTRCLTLDKPSFVTLISDNKNFGNFFRERLAAKAKLWNRSARSRDANSFMISQIDADCMRQPLVLPADTSIDEAVREMRAQKQDCVLVVRDRKYGMITGTDLLKALIIEDADRNEAVGNYACYKLVCVEKGDFLFNALVMMTRHHIERVVVMEQDKLAGIVELTDILSFFSSHSHVIGLQIEKASSISQLRRAAKDLNGLVESLIELGVRIPFAMDLLAALNARIMSKLFRYVMPQEVLNNTCLIVLGSEGRGEQILKTDQDNALIVRNGFVHEELPALLDKFSEELVSFGFPPCPGKVMVNNPKWVMEEDRWQEQIGQWFATPTPDAMIDLAIVLDAHPIGGDKKLFKKWQKRLIEQPRQDLVTLGHMARGSLEFSTPLTFFGNLKTSNEGIDIKKGGIFPLVNGLRTLSLENKIKETNSYKRLAALVKAQVIEAATADNISEALSLFVEIRLKQQIARLNDPAAGALGSNDIEIKKLNRLERDLLREALQVVKEFKALLSRHYQIQ